jgi:hydroxymethylbilane synthase
MNHALGGSCSVPVGAWCMRSEKGLHLRGLVGDPHGGSLLHAHADGSEQAPEALGRAVAESLLAQGAATFLGRH